MAEKTREGLSFHETPGGSPASYSAAVRAGGLIFTAGQIGVAAGAQPVEFRAQAAEALRRLIRAVEAAGGSLGTIIKVNGYLADIDDWPAYDEVYRSIVAVQPKPARTTVQVGRLPAPILVEVDAVALVQAVSAER